MSVMMAAMLITGCSGSSDGKKVSVGNQELKENDLSIDAFEWGTREKVIEGTKCYSAKLTNNSDYDLLGVEIDYKLKDDVSEKDLKRFDGFMEEHKDYFTDDDETVDHVTLIGKRQKLVKAGDSIDNIVFAIGMNTTYWYDVPDKNQYEIMEPNMLQLAIVGKDNNIYIAYYDFVNEEWSLDERTGKVNDWFENDLTAITPKPECEYFVVESDKETDYMLSFTAYGMDKEAFDTYNDSVREAGYTKDSSELSGYYSAKDKDGNSISTDYDEMNKTMEVTVYPAD